MITKLSLHPDSVPNFTQTRGVLCHKHRIWQGTCSLHRQVIEAMHSSALGGHSGIPATYHRLKQYFSWPGMKASVQAFVRSCTVCQQAKPDCTRYPGLLQPLHVPVGSWEMVSLDFVEGLPRSGSANCILVVVDKFSKFAHFVPMHHPFMAFTVAKSAYHGGGGGRFEHTYRCYPASSAARPHLETGDKVILPASALHRLASLRIEYPMLFELRGCSNASDDAPRASHCAVLEFVADEGMVVMPGWMMANLRLRSGDAVRVRSAALPKGTYIKLRPHAAAFLDVSNPKAVLEKTLRAFSCFTTGDTIMVAYNNRSYRIDIVEMKPATAVSIVDTDCEVDFAPPLDYKEPEKPQQPTASPAEAGDDDNAEVKDDEPPEFRPFTSSGKRLDGKASELSSEGRRPSSIAARSAAPSDSNGRGNKQQTSSVAPAASAASSSSARQKTGKLVFGSSARSNTDNNEAQKAPVKQAEKPDEPKFQVFTGKSYSLKK
ncbi:ubiquitin fusion degradation protein 1 homolog [Panicum virgatum]|uniref:ubiquitin fusion degradation protein 1 homolog n=1 Tax=Panicum virgatum TaxID=38727 RepID=UPI0019D6A32A|nr:ubiquitin fusion degradation protein 1 homolog [Panicum virgatum]